MPRHGPSGPVQIDEPIAGKLYDARLVRRLLPYVRPYGRLVLASLLYLLALSVFQLAQPWLLKRAIDVHVAARDLGGLNVVAVLFLLALVGEAIFRSLHLSTTMITGQRVVFDLRMDVFRHLQRLEAAFYDRNPVGRLITRATTDVEAIEEMFSSGVVTIVGDVVRLLAILTMMLLWSVPLTLAALAVIPPLALLSLRYRRRIREAYRIIRHRLSRINGYLQENILGIKVVKLFAQEGRCVEEFDELVAEHRQSELRGVSYETIFSAFIELMGTLAVALIVWWGGRGVLHETITFGTLFAFLVLAEKFFAPIQDLAVKVTFLQSAMASSERVFALLDTEPALVEAEEPRLPEAGCLGEVEFRGVRLSYLPEEEVLHGIDLKLRPGERVALVGATGSGKTSMARLLVRLYDATAGAVLLDGVDVREWPVRELRRHVALVLQDPFLFSGTILENIRLEDRDVPEERVFEAAETLGADRFIRRFSGGYDYPVREGGTNLSHGERQLVSFARALVHDPEVLVLDEATSSIDSETERLVENAMGKLLRGRTALVIAHRLSTVRTADRIVVLHHGEVREEGSHQELMALGGIYSRLWRLQFEPLEKGGAA